MKARKLFAGRASGKVGANNNKRSIAQNSLITAELNTVHEPSFLAPRT